MSIVINTPTSHTGRALAVRLLDAGERITVLSRDKKKVDELFQRGARVVEGSFEEAALLAEALEGAEALFWLTPPPARPDYYSWAVKCAKQAATAAKKAGVRRAVVLSSMGAQTGPGTGAVGPAREMENDFEAALPAVVSLRPGIFMENFLLSTDMIANAGQVFTPLPAGKKWPLSWIVIFSHNSSSWGSFTYDQSEDALRLTVKPETIENHDALSYDFDDPKPDSVVLTMRWEKVAVPFTIQVNTPEIVEQSLRKQLRGRARFEWQPWTEAANYLLTNKLNTEEAVKHADHSIENEDRFENEITKAHALSILGRKDEALAAHDKAIALGTQSQVHDFGRGLQAQGRQDEALDLFRSNIKKDPNSWIGHNEAARIAVAEGNFDMAVKEMKLAATAAPDSLKTQHADLIRRLENKEDINK